MENQDKCASDGAEKMAFLVTPQQRGATTMFYSHYIKVDAQNPEDKHY